MRAYSNVIFYMLFTALSFTFIDKLGDLINPLFSLFFMAACATIWFNLVNYKNLNNLYTKCKQHKLLYVLVTITIGINWLCSIFAPNKSDPFVYIAAAFITMAICGLISKKKESWAEFYIEWGCIILLALSAISMHYNYSIHVNKSTDVGLVLGAISGVSGYYYSIFSSKFARVCSFSASQVLALRFWPLIVVLGIFILSRHLEFLLKWDSFMMLALMSFLSLIIPVFFLQKAIVMLNVNKLSISLAATPIICFLTYAISTKRFNLSNFIICIVLTLVLILSKILLIYIKHRLSRHKHKLEKQIK